jgi:hypothetical protein
MVITEDGGEEVTPSDPTGKGNTMRSDIKMITY